MRNFVIPLVLIFGGCASLPGGYKGAPTEPDKILSFSDHKGKLRQTDVYILNPREFFENVIKPHAELTGNVSIIYSDEELKKLVSMYVDEKVPWMPKAFRDEAKNNFFTQTESAMKTDWFDLLKKYPDRYVVIYPNEANTSRSWAAYFFGFYDPSILKEHNGISDVLIEEFIRYHEDAHAMGLNEPQADRYAALSILRKYGLDSSALSTLQFLSDKRLFTNTGRYVGCHTAIQTILNDIPSTIDDAFMNEFENGLSFDPMHNMYVDIEPFFYERDLANIQKAINARFFSGRPYIPGNTVIFKKNHPEV